MLSLGKQLPPHVARIGLAPKIVRGQKPQLLRGALDVPTNLPFADSQQRYTHARVARANRLHGDDIDVRKTNLSKAIDHPVIGSLFDLIDTPHHLDLTSERVGHVQRGLPIRYFVAVGAPRSTTVVRVPAQLT